MKVETLYDGVEIHRLERMVIAKFTCPHRVISTCSVNGGISGRMDAVFNHQSCDPSGSEEEFRKIMEQTPEQYHTGICRAHALQPDTTVALGTAVNMDRAVVETAGFRDLQVAAVATAGVESNAGRAGDYAMYYEENGKFINIGPESPELRGGTINLMVFVNRDMLPGALVRMVMMATEAKTAALQELSVNSRYSDGLATGTGTDQIAVACRMSGDVPLTGAGKHTKLGELTGITVMEAVKRTLALQNGLTPGGQASVKVHLERFGIDRKGIVAGVCSHLTDKVAELFVRDFEEINRAPSTVAAVAAAVHLFDKFKWGTIHAECMPAIMSDHIATVAAAVYGGFDIVVFFRNAIAPRYRDNDNESFIKLICFAIAIGYTEGVEASGRRCSDVPQNVMKTENNTMMINSQNHRSQT